MCHAYYLAAGGTQGWSTPEEIGKNPPCSVDCLPGPINSAMIYGGGALFVLDNGDAVNSGRRKSDPIKVFGCL